MANVLVEETSLQNIANSIREKTGTTDTYKPSEMASAISSIEAGGGSVPEKGLIIDKYNQDGAITEVSLVGYTVIPASFLSGVIKHHSKNTDNKQLFYDVTCNIPEGVTEIPYECFMSCDALKYINLPKAITNIGAFAFGYCTSLNITEIPSSVTYISNYAFQNCSSATFSKLPENLEGIYAYTFDGCGRITVSEIPFRVTELYAYAFRDCTSLTEMTCQGAITSIRDYVFDGCSKLAKFLLPNITSVPTLANTNAFRNTSIAKGTGYIYVPDTMLDSFKSATTWSAYADQIKSTGELDLFSINIQCNSFLNLYYNEISTPFDVTYNGRSTSLSDTTQEGYTISVNGNATINGNVLTLTDDAQVGDIITVTVTSTYDNSLSSTQKIEVIYKEPSIEINLNNGQWVDSGTTADNGNIIYKSDVGSYYTNNGKSTAILTVTGYTSVKLYIRSYAESSYDYTEAFAIDTTATRAKGLFSTKNNNSATNYVECVYELDGGTHTIQIMYSKDGSGNSNDDRGYFYIGECSE
jgi:hypothetical protein